MLGISELERGKPSGSRLGRREVAQVGIVSLGGQSLVTGWAAAVTGWVFAHPVNMLAEALQCDLIVAARSATFCIYVG